MLTKAEARTQIREWLDDPAAKRWSDSRLDLATQFVLDDLWTDMLDMQSLLTSQFHQITSFHSPGYIDLRLTTNGGDLTQRLYRIQHVTRGGREYRWGDPRDLVIESNALVAGGPDFTYYVLGDQLWMFPLSTSDAVELRYSYKPITYTSLTNGNGVQFPEGSESAYVLGTAALAMAKGNVEDAGQLLALADQAKNRCFAAIRRQYHGMTVPFTTGTGQDMGGI
jgi:hypothetical protein